MPWDGGPPLSALFGDFAIGNSSPVPRPMPDRWALSQRNSAAPGPPPSVLLYAVLQFDPQNLGDFFLELYQTLRPLCTGPKPCGLPLQNPDLVGQRIPWLGRRSSLSRQPLQLSPLTLLTPLREVRGAQPLAPKKGTTLTTTAASLRCP